MHVTVEKLTPPVTSSTYVSPKFMSSESNESHEAELHSPASSLETYGSKSAIFPQQTHPVITGLSPLYEQPETGLLTTSSSTSSNGLSVMVTTGKTVVVTTATTCSPGSKKSINSSNGNVKSISDVVYEDRMETAWKDSLETTRSRMSFERKQRNTKVWDQYQFCCAYCQACLFNFSCFLYDSCVPNHNCVLNYWECHNYSFSHS